MNLEELPKIERQLTREQMKLKMDIQSALMLRRKPEDVDQNTYMGEWISTKHNSAKFRIVFNELLDEDPVLKEKWNKDEEKEKILDLIEERMSKIVIEESESLPEAA